MNALWEPKFRVWLTTTTRGSLAASSASTSPRVVGAGVVDEDDLVVDAERAEGLRQPRVHLRDRRGVPVAGDDGAELLHRATTVSAALSRGSSASIAVRAIAFAERPCASFMKASLPTDSGRSATPQRTTRQPEPALGDDLRHERAEPARQVVRLDGHRERGASQRAGQRVRRRGAQARGDHEPSMPAARLEELDRRDGLVRDRAGGDDRDVPTGTDLLDRAEPESTVEPGHRLGLVLAEPEVDGSRHGAARDQGGAGLLVVGGREHGHPGLRAHHGDVLERVVRQPVHPVLETAADADDPHRQAVQHRPVADELVRPERGERRDRVGERDVPGLGEARRDPDHVLLRDADVEEPVREPLGERLDDGEAEVAREQDDALVLRGELDECPDEGRPHAATSCIARSNCPSVIGR